MGFSTQVSQLLRWFVMVVKVALVFLDAREGSSTIHMCGSNRKIICSGILFI